MAFPSCISNIIYSVYIKHNKSLLVTNRPKRKHYIKSTFLTETRKMKGQGLISENSAAVIMIKQVNEKKIHIIVTIQYRKNEFRHAA